MTYWDVPSGVVVHAGETVSLVESLAVTVLAWPAPVPALIVTKRPTHRLIGHALVMSWSVVLVCLMAYLDVPSGVVVHAGETVRMFLVLEDTVLVWPAPVPAVIVTGRPVHMLVCHDLLMSWSVVLVVFKIAYLDVPSGIVVQAGETVSVLAVLEVTVRVWPTPVPAVSATVRPAHWSVVHAWVPVLVVSWSVVLVCRMTYLDVASGVVVQAGETVRVVAVLEVTARVWPAPVPAVMLSGRPAQRLIDHDLLASTSVVLVPPLAVPVSLVA